MTHTAGRRPGETLCVLDVSGRERTHTVGKRILLGSVFGGVHINMLLRVTRAQLGGFGSLLSIKHTFIVGRHMLLAGAHVRDHML